MAQPADFFVNSFIFHLNVIPVKILLILGNICVCSFGNNLTKASIHLSLGVEKFQ